MSANRLMEHYVDNARVLPWRAPPGSSPPDPYRVWLSEVMLQQTTVAAAAPRFERFIARWPTVEALAAAPDEAVLGEWAGLGYYARARNLIACSREVVRLGGFPRTEAELRGLPGVGDYTAAAIAAIAFGVPAAVVDTNIARVVARLHALAEPRRDELRSLVAALTPLDRPGDFAQAMMDLGATICRPKAPDCSRCPLSQGCAARATGQPENFPRPKARRARPERQGVAEWIERDGHVWLVRRPARGPLARMTALPGGDWTGDSNLAGDAIGSVRHVFTHFALTLRVLRGGSPAGEGWWHPIDGLAEAGLPTLYRRAAEVALRGREGRRAA